MAAPKTTQWPLDEHTRGKHDVLEKYLNVWLPVMSRSNGRILFLDGFSGPGRYSRGERGSPLIALDAFFRHRDRESWKGEANFFFIDDDDTRIAALVNELRPYQEMAPGTVGIGAEVNTFAAKIDEIRDDLAAKGQRMAPAFVMVDPFGVKGVNMRDLEWLLSQPSTEIYVSVMADHMARFCDGAEFPPHITALYGGDAWKAALKVGEFDARRAALLNIYEDVLRNAARHVLRFDLYDGNDFKYSIFFATNHEKGSTAMKDAIWKVMPGGSYEFRAVSGGQLALGVGHEPNYADLSQEVLAFIRDGEWHDIEELDTWAHSDETRYRHAHLRKALTLLESTERIDVTRTNPRRRQFPEGTEVRRRY